MLDFSGFISTVCSLAFDLQLKNIAWPIWLPAGSQQPEVYDQQPEVYDPAVIVRY
jgi:hypothetical protein